MATDADRTRHQEGPEAAKRFEGTMRRIWSVPKDELAKRETDYQKTRRAKRARPKQRG